MKAPQVFQDKGSACCHEGNGKERGPQKEGSRRKYWEACGEVCCEVGGARRWEHGGLLARR